MLHRRSVSAHARERVLQSNVTPASSGLRWWIRALTNVALWRLISYYRANALDAASTYSPSGRASRVRWRSLFTVLLAIPFVLGSLRSAGTGTRMLMGLILGISFFLLQRLIESGTIVFNLNPITLAGCRPRCSRS